MYGWAMQYCVVAILIRRFWPVEDQRSQEQQAHTRGTKKKNNKNKICTNGAYIFKVWLDNDAYVGIINIFI